MPRRCGVSVLDVASFDTLAWAFWRSARGLRSQHQVMEMAKDLDGSLAQLSSDLLAERVPYNSWTRFTILDPKRRLILAPCFRDRVIQHAMMFHMCE